MSLMEPKNRYYLAAGLIGFSLILGFYIRNALCITPTPEFDGCWERGTQVLSTFCSGPFMVGGVLLLADTIGKRDSPGPVKPHHEGSLTIYSITDSKQQEKINNEIGLAWGIVSVSGFLWIGTIVLGSILLVFVLILEGLSNSSTSELSSDVLSGMLEILRWTFWSMIVGVIIMVRPWSEFQTWNENRPKQEASDSIIQRCPTCDISIRIPVSHKGAAKCPQCKFVFQGSSTSDDPHQDESTKN